MNQRTLKKYFETALTLADEGKVKRLFASLGYRDYQKITPEMCIEALNAHGSKFSQPFGTLAKSALSTPKVESFMAAHGIIDRLPGVSVPATATAPTTIAPITSVGVKTSNSGWSFLDGFEMISNFLIEGTDSVGSLLNILKGKDIVDSQAKLTEAQAKLAASTKPNWALILGIFGVIVVIVIVVLVALKKNK